MNESNVEIVQSIYAAFGRGDVPAIQARCTSDTRWDFAVAQSAVPWHEPVTSRSEVGRFLGAFVENVVLEQFEPRLFVADGGHVVAHIAIAYTVRRTGRRVAMDQIHWWTLASGEVTRLRHFEDTAQVREAWTQP